MAELKFVRVNRDEPNSLYEVYEDDKLISSNLTYEQAVDMIIRKDNERWEKLE